jgi:hypothetical protein
VSRLSQILFRRPPLVAPRELIGQPGLTFGVTMQSEPAGWTVTAYGPDGRRLGRPLKSLSDSVQTTLAATIDRVQGSAERERLAAAWVEACRSSVTNAEVLTGFSDAATEIASDSAP